MSKLTPRVVAFTASCEGLCREMYLDSKGIPSWAMGVAATSGYDVQKFKDNPQPLDVCLKASIDLVTKQYLPRVLKAFPKLNLSEAQLAAALSFEWNTGELHTAHWVEQVNAGDFATARVSIMSWGDHGLLTQRRRLERNLFFDGKWPSDMRAVEWSVRKPSYKTGPGHDIDVLPLLQQIMGGS